MNLIRDAVRLVMQELIELEATETIGAARYERTETRTTRNVIISDGKLINPMQLLTGRSPKD